MDPVPDECWATLATRERKEGSETTEEALARWQAETKAAVGTSLAEVWTRATEARLFDPDASDPPPEPSDEVVLEGAIEALKESHSTWTRYDLARAVTLALPARTGVDPDDLLARIDALVESATRARAEELGVINLAQTAPSRCPIDCGGERTAPRSIPNTASTGSPPPGG